MGLGSLWQTLPLTPFSFTVLKYNSLLYDEVNNIVVSFRTLMGEIDGILYNFLL